MFNLPENQSNQIENWIKCQINAKIRRGQICLIFQNSSKDSRYYQVRDREDTKRLTVIKVQVEQILETDVDYWIIKNGGSVPQSSKLEIPFMENQTQFILLFIDTVYEQTFWFEIILQVKLQELKNYFQQNPIIASISRKEKANSTCPQMQRLVEWNKHYPISLYKKEIEEVNFREYRGYICNKDTIEKNNHKYEDITILLYANNFLGNEIEYKVRLVNEYTIENKNPLTYTSKNISINQNDTFELIIRNKFEEIINQNYKNYFRNFSKIRTITTKEFKDREIVPETFSVLMVFGKKYEDFQLYYHVGIFMGNGEIVEVSSEPALFKKTSIEEFIKDQDQISIQQFDNRVLPDEEIQSRIAYYKEYYKEYKLTKNNCENIAYACVLDCKISLQVKSFFDWFS